MEKGDSVLVPRTSGEYSPGTVVFIKDGQAMVEFLLGATYRGQKSSNPNKIGTKFVPVDKLIPIPKESIDGRQLAIPLQNPQLIHDDRDDTEVGA